MTYQLYRNSSIGVALQETLDVLTAEGLVSPFLAIKVLQRFDRSISMLLSKNRAEVVIKASRLLTYRLCDSVWTFALKDVDIRDQWGTEITVVKLLKIVACEAKSERVYFLKGG